MQNTTSAHRNTIVSKPTSEKAWSTVVKIGRHIERELKVDRTNETLSRWMAHRIAELMERGERARTASERERARANCTDLIVRLWEKRAQLPAGAPLGPFADFLEHFVKQKSFSFPAPESA